MTENQTDSADFILAGYDELARDIEALTSLARSKRAALVACDLEAVDSISRREEELVTCASRHAEAIRASGQAHGDGEQAGAAGLAARKAYVEKCASHLARETRLTALLARRSIAHFAGLLEILTGASSRPVTYNPRGKERRGPGARVMLDARI